MRASAGSEPAFDVDPLDITYTLPEWRILRRISATTERRMRKLGVGPRLVALSPGRWGVTRRDDLAWVEAGGASGVHSADPAPVMRNSGRDTRAATAASVAKRAQRKAAAAPIATSAEPSATESANATV